MQDEQQVSEEKLREALARLGAGGHKSPNRSRPIQSSHEKRRRFVRDGQVVVEHQSAGRHHVQARAHTARTQISGQEDQEEIERLRQSVKREQRRWEETERHLNNLKQQLRVFETREAHDKLRIGELGQDLQQARDLIQSLKTEIHRMRDNLDETPKRPPRSVGRPRKHPEDEATETTTTEHKPDLLENVQEPQPVQWWIKS